MSTKKQIRETLIPMGFEPKYVSRALKIYEKNYGCTYNVQVITEIIVRLQGKDKLKLKAKLDKDANPSNNKKQENKESNLSNKAPQIQNNPLQNINNYIPFLSHMTIEDALKLNINDTIDHRYNYEIGIFARATIVQKQGTNLKVHYVGWSRKYDTWSDFRVELYRFAKEKSISKRPAHRLKQLQIGDSIDINPKRRHQGWRHGVIRRLNKNSGQIQVCYAYEADGEDYLYWTHLDDTQEIAPFASKSFAMPPPKEEKSEHNKNTNNSKRKLSDNDVCDDQPLLKKRKLSDNNSNNMDINDILEKNKILQKRLDLLDLSDKISVMNLDELNDVKNIFKSKIKLIEEAEKELIDNTYKCVACMDKPKNISFDGCSHMALCDECESSLQIKKCPICQKPYKNAKKINF